MNQGSMRALVMAVIAAAFSDAALGRNQMNEIVFATFAQDRPELEQALVLARSLRSFGGALKDSPFWLYLPSESPELSEATKRPAVDLNIELRQSPTPEEAQWFFYSGKTFAAGNAEGEAAGRFKIMAWLDADNIIVQEPKDFILSEGIDFGCRPVMLKLIGSDHSQPPDGFWSNLYRKYSIDPEKVFAVTTPVDDQMIRAYFNAGMLIVRPEKGLLRRWAIFYEKLYSDQFFKDECRRDVKKRIFLHQAALAGAVLKTFDPGQIVCLDERYNYPFFFFEKYPPAKQLKSLDEAVTVRHDGIMYQDKEWRVKMKDKSKIADWIKEEFSSEGKP